MGVSFLSVKSHDRYGADLRARGGGGVGGRTERERAYGRGCMCLETSFLCALERVMLVRLRVWGSE